MKVFPKILLLTLSVILGATARVFVDPHLNHDKPNAPKHHQLYMARRMIPKRELQRMNHHSKTSLSTTTSPEILRSRYTMKRFSLLGDNK